MLKKEKEMKNFFVRNFYKIKNLNEFSVSVFF